MSEIHDIILDLVSPREVGVDTVCSTGIMSLDEILGSPLPAGITEIYGEASTGKTSLLYLILRQAQIEGKQVALCPTEYLDIPYMNSIGLDTKSLTLILGNTARDTYEAALDFLDQKNCILAIDSSTSIPSDSVPERNWELFNFLQEAKDVLNRGCGVILTSQVRAKRSVVKNKMFAGGTDSSAKRVAHQFCTRFELSRTDVSETKYNLIVDVVANPYSAPSCYVKVPVVKGRGVVVEIDLLREACKRGIVVNNGSWYYFNNSLLGQGEEKTADYIASNKQLAFDIVSAVRKKRGF